MSDGWKSYRGAPEPGTVVCGTDAIQDGGSLCLDIDGFPLLLVRVDDTVRAFVNACPHQFLPLNYRGQGLLSADGKKILCTNHDATFSVATGVGVGGPGLGACLDVVPVTTRDGVVEIGT